MVTERNAGSNTDGFRSAYKDYIADFCTTVTVTRTTKTKDSMKRVIGTSTSTSTIKADIQWVTKKDLDHINMGSAQIGDGMMFVEHDADVELEDEITYNSVQWTVIDQIEGEQVEGNVIYKAFIIHRNDQT